MLSIKTQCNLANAEDYFAEHLQSGEYYSQGGQTLGEWVGQGSQRLGLKGTVRQEEFLRLCRNQNPFSGERLTQRMKTTRWDANDSREVANRRVLFDFTFSPPKSVSVMALVMSDSRIIQSHDRAVRSAVRELERFAGTRVHRNLTISERLTRNTICALFRHDTSRALDPHLHTHCIMFNATHDQVEQRWKALSNFEMLRARKFAENVYYHELARELRDYGYEIDNRARGDFEIKGVYAEVCTRFAKRHQEIDEATAEVLSQKPALAGSTKELRAKISQEKRSRKVAGIDSRVLRRVWEGQLQRDQRRALAELTANLQPRRRTRDAEEPRRAVSWAESHLFDRRSVVREHELWSCALEHGRGGSFSVEDMRSVTQRMNYVRDDSQPDRLTTLETLGREWKIVCLAREGRGRYPPFHSHYAMRCDLQVDQRKAVEQILGSRDFVTLFAGGAGTGKSHTLQEIALGLTAAGLTFQVIAPQRQQAIDLRKNFDHAETVSEFLAKRDMPAGAVVIVDEAGQIGGKQMHDLLSFLKARNGRVILSGDTRQHGAVEASDALRAIERYAGLQTASLTRIRRQNPKHGETKSERKRIKQYRAAVRQAQRGNYAESFHRLDRLGAIVQCRSTDEQRERLVAAYLDLAERKKSTVVVSQTWGEIHEINERIRIGLRSAGLVGKDDFSVTALERVDLTDAQKRDECFYEGGAVVVFNRGVPGFMRGDSGKLVKITRTHLLVEANGRIGQVPFAQLDRISVCREKEMKLAKGDRLQLKANSRSADGKELVNGEIVTIETVGAGGRIQLKDGRVLPASYREFVRGYAVTSYGSQGKTVENVLFSDSAVKAATNHQQWLVSISRGTRGLKIFTQDKEQLQENICRSSDRELAIELANSSSRRSGGTPQVIRRYVENLIKNRRPAARQTNEGRTCKQELKLKMAQARRHGVRI